MALSPAAHHTQTREFLLSSFEDRLKSLRRSPYTVISYRRHVRNLSKTYPNVPLESLTAEHIERHLFDRPVGARSQVAELSGIKAFFQYLIKQQRLVKVNPCDDVERPSYREPLMPAPTFAEFEALFARCKTLEERVLVNLFYQTAVRLREGMGLRVRQVSIQAREVRVEAGKGNKDRVSVFDPAFLPAHLRLAPLLEAHTAGKAPQGLLFPGRSPHWFQRLLVRLGQEVGLSFRLRPHLLRHGWVLWSAESGLPIDAAQEQLGHSSIATTAGAYRKVTAPRLKRAMDQHMRPPGLDILPRGHKPVDRAAGMRYGENVATETTQPVVTVQLARELHDQVREVAFKERTSIKAIMDAATKDWLDKRNSKRK